MNNDIDAMLESTIQDYYGNEYLSYQRSVISRNPLLLQDQDMIADFFDSLDIKGNMMDVGAGNCQWFHRVSNNINTYYAVDANHMALSVAPQDTKLVTVNRNVFDNDNDIVSLIQDLRIDSVMSSFFLSHFSDASIISILKKFQQSKQIIIIDSLWSPLQRERQKRKGLSLVKRKVSEDRSINIPKRFFERSDIEGLALALECSVKHFVEGNYWFAATMEKRD